VNWKFSDWSRLIFLSILLLFDGYRIITKIENMVGKIFLDVGIDFVIFWLLFEKSKNGDFILIFIFLIRIIVSFF
jgi:hypothetical protein